MNRHTLQTVLRSFAEAGLSVTDADLLRRFVEDRDEHAFAGLIERHGRLVWAVCRNLTRSEADADDAFQATFIVLMKRAAKIREAAKLPAWLHGVAYRICSKARNASQKRAARERATAIDERNGSTIAESAWDRALAAVHEEVARLPESLRVPFVLCCLEGKGVTEAAELLGWKLGTLSGRLTRAKDALLARLEARGIALGVAASLTLVSATGVPAAIAEKATAWFRGREIPGSILQLSEGAMAMSATQGKILAAVLILVCGLGLNGAGWLATAEAQSPPGKGNPNSIPDTPSTRYDDVVKKYLAAAGQKPTEGAVASTAKWDYDFVLVSDLTPVKFVEFLKDRETRGWEYNGQSTLLHHGKAEGHWVFRRPKAAVPYSVPLPGANPNVPQDFDAQAVEEALKAIKARIADAEAKAAGKAAGKPAVRIVPVKLDKPQDVASLLDLLEKSSARKFGTGKLKMSFDPRPTGGIHLEGSTEAVDWAADIITKLAAN